VDLVARRARRIDTAPDGVVDERLARVQVILERDGSFGPGADGNDAGDSLSPFFNGERVRGGNWVRLQIEPLVNR
jgi:hypothetical protein